MVNKNLSLNKIAIKKIIASKTNNNFLSYNKNKQYNNESIINKKNSFKIEFKNKLSNKIIYKSPLLKFKNIGKSYNLQNKNDSQIIKNKLKLKKIKNQLIKNQSTNSHEN